MENRKTVYLVFFLLFLLTIIILTQIFRTPINKTGPQTQQPLNPITQTPSILDQFNITNISDTSKPIYVTNGIIVKFSESVDTNTLKISISPQVKFLPLFNSDTTELTIQPDNVWPFNTDIHATIFNQTKSVDGKNLDKDYEIYFKTVQYTGI